MRVSVWKFFHVRLEIGTFGNFHRSQAGVSSFLNPKKYDCLLIAFDHLTCMGKTSTLLKKFKNKESFSV